MKVGIIGSGVVGRALGRGFVKHGHQVKIGTRDTGKKEIQDWIAENNTNGSAGSLKEAALFGEIVILCTAWDGTENAVKLADPKNLAGKVLIDVTNPLDFSKGVPPVLAVGHNDSGGENVQRWLPDSKVVKCWNIIGNADMIDPEFEGGKPDMFICGNDEEAKKKVGKIVEGFGWLVHDLGGIEISRYLEPFAMLWVTYGFRNNSWRHIFKLVKK